MAISIVSLRKNTFFFLFSILLSGSGCDALSKAFFNGRNFSWYSYLSHSQIGAKCTDKVLLCF